MRVSGLETLDWGARLGHILILILRAKPVANGAESGPIVDDVVLAGEEGGMRALIRLELVWRLSES